MSLNDSVPNRGRLKRELRKLNIDLGLGRQFDSEIAGRILSDTFLALCESVNSPVSLGMWLRFKYNELYDPSGPYGLVQREADPRSYLHWYEFKLDYQVCSFLKKYRDFKIPVDREAAAHKKWLESEVRCRGVNEAFRSMWSSDITFMSATANAIYHRACAKICYVLGPQPPDDILSRGRFGPGSDLSTWSNRISRFYKYSSPGSCTPGIRSLLSDFTLDDIRADIPERAELVSGSRLTFVPKTAIIDRAICVEPRWNIFYQLSIGDFIEKKLKSFGYDISDQGRNQTLASRAYHDQLSTIDLSSASDTVSKNLVLDMLPEAWADLLFKTRSPTTTYRGETYELEKISSMGNGFTFPLETLIFSCLAEAACELHGEDLEDVAVYGDDIIVPKVAAHDLIETLATLGFDTNVKKTYIDSVFFESCGADFFCGRNVRPVFLKEKVSNVERAYRLVNQITDFARSFGDSRFAVRRFSDIGNHVIRHIPKSLRLYGPANAGDGCIHAPLDKSTPHHALSGWQGYFIPSLLFKPQGFYRAGDALLLAKLDGPDLDGNFVVHRNQTLPSVGLVYVLRYEDFILI